MHRILVTGASGFLGHHLLHVLQEHHAEIHTIDPKPTPIGIQHPVSLADAAALKDTLISIKPDSIVHLAGITNAADIRTYYAINTGLASNLIWALKEWGNRDCPILLTGTSAEYGLITREQLPITENTPAQPYDHYGISKLAQTLMGVREARDGWPLIMIRPFNIIGPGMPAHLALQSFIEQVIKIMHHQSEPIIETGDLSPYRDLVDARDVAQAIWQLLQTPAAYGEIINICTGIGTSMGDLLDKLIKMTNVDAEIRVVSQRVKPLDVPVHFGSNEKLRSLTGLTPQINLDTTLQDVLAHNLSIIK
jgi:GDP-4-dehydro-6-deoxy-D-mannose reductase